MNRNIVLFSAIICLMAIYQRAFSQCQTCVGSIPTTTADTLFIGTLTSGLQNQVYGDSLSFRFPYTTNTLPGAPAGITINSVEIIDLTNLPSGLNYTFDTVPAIYDEVNPDFRDGCISICGTPLSSGTFIININTQVNLPVLGNQPYTFIVDLTILPDTTPTFTYMSSNTCDTAWVNFINNNASTNPDIHYSWDFGNGDTSVLASPDSVYYNQPGTYVVNYQQIVDTFPYILERVVVTATDCNDDLFSPAAPDLYLILDSSGTEVINNDFGAFLDDGSDTYAPDTILSGSVELNPLATYTIAVQDDDPFGDDLCGSFTMTTADYTGAPIVYTDGVHTIEVIMTKATDTINYSDTVVVPMCIPVSLSDKIASNLFIVYPNPADNNLNVAYQNDNLNHDAKIEIFTIEGKLVHSELLTSTITTISISDLDSGQYFMKIFNKTNRILQTDQFIKN